MRGLPTQTVWWRVGAKREAYARPRTKDAAAGTSVGRRGPQGAVACEQLPSRAGPPLDGLGA